MGKYKLVLLGGSAGGFSAFQSLLARLPEDFNLPIVIIHHLPSQSKIDAKLAYGGKTQLQVIELEDKQKLLPGCVYFAPADYHLLIEKDLTVSFDVSEPVNFSRPSIDVTFESAADSLGAGVVAALLTGANSDGANGILSLYNCGAKTFIQDPKDAEASLMPESGVLLSPRSQVVLLSELPKILIELAGTH